eukprot:1159414-Pelagomonas_calceolata.AAC.1
MARGQNLGRLVVWANAVPCKGYTNTSTHKQAQCACAMYMEGAWTRGLSFGTAKVVWDAAPALSNDVPCAMLGWAFKL